MKKFSVVTEKTVGNTLEITPHIDGSLWFELENPWAGSSETGFGQTTYANLSLAQTKMLYTWLGDVLENHK